MTNYNVMIILIKPNTFIDLDEKKDTEETNI